jgi:hypothetical protein
MALILSPDPMPVEVIRALAEAAPEVDELPDIVELIKSYPVSRLINLSAHQAKT